MPTLPPHQHRQVAEGFGADAARYDRARPDYPAALIRRVVTDILGSPAGGEGAALLGRPAPVVLDVGCGTGIAARQFRDAGCLVLGVDADPRMAAVARDRGLDVEVARFEEWDAAGRTFDAVVAAQTWHWVDPVAGAAKAAAVLRPGGRLALFWNVFQPPAALAAALGAVYRRVLPELPAANLTDAMAAYRSMVESAADGLAQAGGFGPAEQWRFEWDHTYRRDEWLDQIPTHGGVNRLPQGTLSDLLAGVGAAIDAAGGSVPVHYTTVAVTAVRES